MENENHTKETTASVIYEIKTTFEDIYIHRFKQNINKDLLINVLNGSLDATHVVVGIEWGGTCVITGVHKNSQNKDETIVKTELIIQMNKLKMLLEKVFKETTECKDQDIEFITRSDIMDFSNELPTTFKNTAEFVKCFSFFVKSVNESRGIPLTFHLYPIKSIIKMCNNNIAVIHFQSLLPTTVNKCVSYLENLHETQLKINKMYEYITKHSNYISNAEIVAIIDFHEDHIKCVKEFKNVLMKCVVEVRSTKLSNADIHSLIDCSIEINSFKIK